MAACKILSHSGDGLYAIELLYDTTQHDDRVQELTDFITDIDNINKLTDLDTAAQALFDGLQEGKVILNNEINILSGLEAGSKAFEDQKEKVIKITKEGLEADVEYNKVQKEYLLFNNIIVEKTYERDELLRLGTVENPLLEVWCVDLADGLDGRNIYVAGQLVSLWCMNYDTELYVLPPLNRSHLVDQLLLDFTSLTLEANGGIYNDMRNFTKDVAPASTFYDVAMEVGFARWKPQFMTGTFTGSALPDCRGRKPQVIFPVSNSRFGQELLSGTFDLINNFYTTPEVFKEGDKIVCAVVFPENDPKESKFTEPEVHLIGFFDHPRVSDSSDLLGYHFQSTFLSGGFITDHTGFTTAYSDCVVPSSIRKQVSNTGVGNLGDLSTTGRVGAREIVLEGYSISGVSPFGVTFENDIAESPSNMGNWFSTKTEQTLIYNYVLIPDTSVVVLGSIVYGGVTWTIGVETPRGEWLTYTYTWGGATDSTPDAPLTGLVSSPIKTENFIRGTQRKSSTSFGINKGSASHGRVEWSIVVNNNSTCSISNSAVGDGILQWELGHPFNTGEATIVPQVRWYKDRDPSEPGNLY